MENKIEKVTILADAGLGSMYFIFSMVLVCCEVFVFSLSDSTAVRIIYMIPAVVWIGILVFVSNQWLMVITFCAKGISLHPGIYKPVNNAYNYYQYVYHGYYWHGSMIGIGYQRDFIVLSHKSLTVNQLENVNQIPNSSETVKIKLSMKMLKKLMRIVPTEMKGKLQSCEFV